jgi:hypothetical protein
MAVVSNMRRLRRPLQHIVPVILAASDDHKDSVLDESLVIFGDTDWPEWPEDVERPSAMLNLRKYTSNMQRAESREMLTLHVKYTHFWRKPWSGFPAKS